MPFQQTFFRGLKRLRLLPNNLIDVSALDRFSGREKLLDEYRELLETLEKETVCFSSEQGGYSIGHTDTLDDYLTVLYAIRFAQKPPRTRR